MSDTTENASEEQILAVHRAVEQEALQWYAVSEAPLYVKQLTCVDAVRTVLQGVRCVLAELGLKPSALDGIPVFELAAYWAELLRQLFAQVTIWAPANIEQCTEELMHKIASGIYCMFWERLRYRHFLVNGAPAGVAQLPLYVDKDGQKTYAVNNAWWSVPGKSWAQYASCTSNAPRRKQCLRASACVPNDIFEPRAFA
jgi:hypothetical protein